MEIHVNPIKKLSLPNYTALTILDRLGLSDPSLEQIKIMESTVLIGTYPQQIDAETLRQCVGDNSLAYYFLLVKTNEWCKLKSNEELLVDFESQLEEKEEEVEV